MSDKYISYVGAVKYNSELCSTIAMEECAELIQAISKAKRGKLDKNNMAEEIADVLICVDWIGEIYNIPYEDINTWIEYKQQRIVNRLNQGDFK